jgi:uncharacterized protein (TIGR03437 family)
MLLCRGSLTLARIYHRSLVFAICFFFPTLTARPQTLVNTVAGDGRKLQGLGGPATGVNLSDPYFLAFDPLENLYVSDQIFNQVVRITPAGVATPFAGSGAFDNTGNGGQAAQAAFRYVAGMAFDKSGNAYIADVENDVIRKITPAGIITPVAGGGNCGPNLGDGGPAINACLGLPQSPTVGPDGNLYIADTYHHLIRKVDSSGLISTVAGLLVQPSPGSVVYPGGFSGDNGPALQALLNLPSRVVFDSQGNMYICEWVNARIRKVNTSGIITTFAGGGTQAPASGLSATAIYLSGPHDVAIDRSDNLYIADTYHDMVLKVSPAGTVTVAAGDGYHGPTFSGDGGPATSALLYNPGSAAIDGSGNLYIADQGYRRVRRVDSSGIITTWAGSGQGNYCCDSGPAVSAELDRPLSLTFDPAGNMLIADTQNHRIRKVDTAGNISTIAGTGKEGYSGDGGTAALAMLDLPTDVATDSAGNIYVADSNNTRVRRISGSGVITTVAGAPPNGQCTASGSVSAPATTVQMGVLEGVTLDSAGRLYITDVTCQQVYIVDTDGMLRLFAGNGIQGYNGDGIPAVNASLSGPAKALPDGAGGVYIADNLNSRVRYVGPDGIIKTVVGNGFTGWNPVPPANPLAVSSSAEYPYGLALGKDGILYISGVTDAVARVTPDGHISMFSPCCEPGFSGDGGPMSNAHFTGPQGAAMDANGDLYIADTNNNRIRKVTLRSLALSNQAVSATVAPGGPRVNTQVSISNAGDGILDWTATATTTPSGGGWLKISAASGIAPSNLTVSTDPGSLAPGTYTGTVTVSSPAAVGSPANISVQMTVAAPTLIVGSKALAFAAGTGQNPPSQPLAISFSGAGSVVNWNATASTSTGGNWLALSAASGSNNATIEVSVNTAGLAAGSYSGSVSITAPGAQNSPSVTGVTLTVSQSPSIAAIVDAWTYTPGLAPGEWVAIAGTALSGADPQTWNLNNGGQLLPTTLGNVTVSFNGVPGPLLYVGPTQINALVPAIVMPGPVSVVVAVNGVPGPPFDITAAATVPAIYAPIGPDLKTFWVTSALQGTGFLVGDSAADSRVIGPVHPGDIIDLYMIGLGATADPSNFNTTSLFAGAYPLGAQVTAAVGGENAQVIFAGLTSPGLYLVRIAVPSDLNPGPASIQVSAGGVPTNSALMLMIGSNPPNLLQDGSFETPLPGGWHLSVDGATGAAATLSETTSTAAIGSASGLIDVTAAGTIATANSPVPFTSIQFWQSGIALEQGHIYSLQFWAKADTGRNLRPAIFQNGGSFTNYGLSATVVPGNTWQRYAFYFQSNATDPSARVTFYLGDQVGNTWLDGVIVQDEGN